MDRAALTSLVAWYRRAARDLPWRRTRDPYAIWVSEIMLQQTRVETVAPRFARWMRRFPTVSALADAPLDDVLAEWAGLGYYARARNLHGAAREVAAHHGGHLTSDNVPSLKGVGRYTAGAIRSIAFGERAPILDGNVIRVLTRLHAIDAPVRDGDAAALQQLWALATALVESGEPPGDVNQALMELGATVCLPRSPRCDGCPVAASCRARAGGEPERYPAPKRAREIPRLERVAVALVRDGEVLLARRPPDGLWGGLFELPTDEAGDGEDVAEAACRIAVERTGLVPADVTPLAPVEQALTHRRFAFRPVVARVEAGAPRLDGYDAHRWRPPGAAADLGVARATARMLHSVAETMERSPR